jgi:hypothetical protein
VFLPADPLREGRLALPAGHTIRRKTVPARLVPIGDALPAHTHAHALYPDPAALLAPAR